MFADGNLAHAREVAEAFGRAFEALARFHGVSIAAINGYAMRGARSSAGLRHPHRRAAGQAGVAGGLGGLAALRRRHQRLTELVGPGWAKRMILCGEKVSATLAYEMGLVEEVVTEGHAWEAAQQMAQLVERQSPSALRACKQLINQGAAAIGTRRCRSSAASFSPCLTMPTSAKGWPPSSRSEPRAGITTNPNRKE
jgi:enoyl-CoA hydratase/carnithine racemase